LIISIVIASIAVIGFSIFLIKRSNLLEAKVEHKLNPDAEKLIDKGLSTFSDSIGRVTNSAEKLGNNVENIIAPVTVGAGNILNALADRIKTKQHELEKLKNQSISLTEEIERLKNRQINITEITAQLKLALIEVNQDYPSFVQNTLESESDDRIEYLSLYTAHYTVNLGIDLDDLQFQVSSGEKLQVYGLHKPILIGMTNLRVERQIDEIRRFSDQKLLGLISEKNEILKNHDQLSKCKDIHNDKLLVEIQQSQSLEYIQKVNAHLALAFLKACLASTGLKIEEAFEPLVDPMRFGEICEELNRKIRIEIDTHRSKYSEVEHKSELISSEILAIANKG
jgi:hypothetical protein